MELREDDLFDDLPVGLSFGHEKLHNILGISDFIKLYLLWLPVKEALNGLEKGKVILFCNLLDLEEVVKFILFNEVYLHLVWIRNQKSTLLSYLFYDILCFYFLGASCQIVLQGVKFQEFPLDWWSVSWQQYAESSVKRRNIYLIQHKSQVHLVVV